MEKVGQLDLKSVVEILETAICDAAEYLVEAVSKGTKLDVRVKPDFTLVMALDLESQFRILKHLKGKAPIVAEEDDASHALIDKESSYFLVDPLDGTTSCKRFLNQRGGQVGFGPLAGYVENGILKVAVFYNVPQRKLYTAVLDQGTYCLDLEGFGPRPILDQRTKLVAKGVDALEHAGVLFYVGLLGESAVVQFLRERNAIENIYRFGGFANDCTRLAHGHEQISVQFAVKPWDYPAVLLCHEAGVKVVVDPLGSKTPLNTWKIAPNNPVIMAHASIHDKLFVLLNEKPWPKPL